MGGKLYLPWEAAGWQFRFWAICIKIRNLTRVGSYNSPFSLFWSRTRKALFGTYSSTVYSILYVSWFSLSSLKAEKDQVYGMMILFSHNSGGPNATHFYDRAFERKCLATMISVCQQKSATGAVEHRTVTANEDGHGLKENATLHYTNRYDYLFVCLYVST